MYVCVLLILVFVFSLLSCAPSTVGPRNRATCIHKMGQEKSLPSRCNSIHNYPLTGATHHRNTHHRHHHHHHNNNTAGGATTTLSSAISSVSLAPSARSSTSTIHTNASRATCKSVQRQTKYLKEQLYIKSYLDLEDQDRAAKKVFQQKTTKTGIRNYTPKILGEKQLNDDHENNNNNHSLVNVGVTSAGAGNNKSNTNTLSSQGCSSATSTLRRDPDAWI